MNKTVLEMYEERYGLEPLTPDNIVTCIETAEQVLLSDVHPSKLVAQRHLLWLSDRLRAYAGSSGTEDRAPAGHRCGWCWNAAGATDEAWRALPTMSLEDIRAHTMVCDHSPLVKRCWLLQAEVEELKRALVADKPWRTFISDVARVPVGVSADQIRALLKSDMPAGELRRELEELVR